MESPHMLNSIIQRFSYGDDLTRKAIFEIFVDTDNRYGTLRRIFVEKMGWTYLDDHACEELCKVTNGKIVLSIGSGKGFVESILANHFDQKVIATDGEYQQYPRIETEWLSAVSAVKAHRDASVLLSIWPTYVASGFRYPTYPGGCDHAEPDKCFNCSPDKRSSLSMEQFQFQKCTNKPAGYNRLSPKGKQEFQRAQMRRQIAEYKKLQEYKPTPAELCVCCAYTDHVADDFAYNALRIFEGDTFIHVGESEGGCTGSIRMWCELAKNWTLEKVIEHPNWNRIYSSVQVYKRKI